MRHHHNKQQKILRRKLMLSLVFLLAAIVGIYLFFDFSDKQAPAVYGDIDGRFSKETVTYDGADYRVKPGVNTFLMMGIDQTEDVEYNGKYRSGGQCDFLLLVVIDTQAKTIHRIQIDRDTMAEITVLGVLGNELGTNTHQICLAHGFGDGKQQSCQYTVDAVRRLMYGIEIDGYYAMNMNGIPALNELLGGVTVRIEDDFSRYDASMVPGAVVTLHGKQTELFVRTRMTIGDGTNVSRMRRQRQYLENAIALAAQRVRENEHFLAVLLDGLAPYTTTDIARGRMINEANRAAGYTVADILSPAGEHMEGEDGFIEFHADQAALMRLVLSLFYEQV